MPSLNLDRIKLGYSPLSQTIHLYREGKEQGIALDKREAEFDVLQVITEMMLHDTDNECKGTKKSYRIGDNYYELQVLRKDKEYFDKVRRENAKTK